MIISMFFPEMIILTIVFESYCPAISTIAVKKLKNIKDFSKEVSQASWLIKKGHNSLKPLKKILPSRLIYNTIRDLRKIITRVKYEKQNKNGNNMAEGRWLIKRDITR